MKLYTTKKTGKCPLTKQLIDTAIDNHISCFKLKHIKKRAILLLQWIKRGFPKMKFFPILYYNKRLDYAFFNHNNKDDFLKKFYSNYEKPDYSNLDRKFNSPQLQLNAEFIIEWVLKLNAKCLQKKNIEIGVGSGWLSKEFKKRNLNITASDSDPRICSYIEKKLKINTIASFIENIENFNTYDSIFSADTFEHFPNPAKAFTSIHSILNKGGILFFTVPNINSLTFQYDLNLHKYFAYPAHLNYFSAKSIEYILKKIGFTDIHIDETTFISEIPYLLEPYEKQKKIKGIHCPPLSRSLLKERLLVYAIKK